MTPLSPEEAHQRALNRQIRLPLLLGGSAILLLVIGLFISSLMGGASYQQIHCLTGGLLILCFLLPLILVMLAFNFLMILMALGAGKLPRMVRPPMVAVQNYADQAVSLTQQASQQVSQPIIKARTEVAFWRNVVESLLPSQKGKSDE